MVQELGRSNSEWNKKHFVNLDQYNIQNFNLEQFFIFLKYFKIDYQNDCYFTYMIF